MQAKTIFAKTLNPECFDYRVYDIREDEGNEIYVDGGKEFIDVDINDNLKHIKKLINEYSDYVLDVYYDKSIMELLRDYLGKKVSPKQAHDIKLALENERDVIITITCLNALTGKIYRCRHIKGIMQSEWALAYYPVDEEKQVEYVECWYFGTGTEVEVHEDENEVNDESDISGWTFYTSSWKVEDIKREIKEYCGYKDDDEVNVVLYQYSGSYNIRKDNYIKVQVKQLERRKTGKSPFFYSIQNHKLDHRCLSTARDSDATSTAA